MKRRGELQFEHQNIPGNHHMEGWAVDMAKGDVVSHVIVTKGITRLYNREHITPEQEYQPVEEPGGQMAMPIHTEQPRVAWASATSAGRRAAAPHLLIAALQHEHGITPVADSTLSPEGAGMARSAAKRGLIKPHPKNPTMEANANPMLYGSREQIDRTLGSDQLGSYEAAHGPFRGQRPVVFSEQQMGLAHQRIFGPRTTKRKTPESAPEQGTLF